MTAKSTKFFRFFAILASLAVKNLLMVNMNLTDMPIAVGAKVAFGVHGTAAIATNGAAGFNNVVSVFDERFDLHAPGPKANNVWFVIFVYQFVGNQHNLVAVFVVA